MFYDLSKIGTLLGEGNTTIAMEPDKDQKEGKILIFTIDKNKRSIYESILGPEHIEDIDIETETMKAVIDMGIEYKDAFYVTKLTDVEEELKAKSSLPEALASATENFGYQYESIFIKDFNTEMYNEEFDFAVRYYTGVPGGSFEKEDRTLELEFLSAASKAIQRLSTLDILKEEIGSSDILVQQFGRLPNGELVCFDPFYFEESSCYT